MTNYEIGGILTAIAAFILRIEAIIAWCVDKWQKISPTIEPIIKQVEAVASDGKITREERKALALSAIAIAEKEGKLKLNIFSRWVINKVVDRVANKLPDITISQSARDLVQKAIAQKQIDELGK